MQPGAERCQILLSIYQDIKDNYSGSDKQTLLNAIDALLEHYECSYFQGR